MRLNLVESIKNKTLTLNHMKKKFEKKASQDLRKKGQKCF